jgi:hypothetical protein
LINALPTSGWEKRGDIRRREEHGSAFDFDW